MAKKLEDILGKLGKAISPAASNRSQKKDEELLQEVELGDFGLPFRGMKAKYKKLIAILEKAGRTDEISRLKQQLAQLIKIERSIREKEENQFYEHDQKIRKDNVKYIQELNEALKVARKGLEEFFVHYSSSFELLRGQLKARVAELQRQLSTILSQLRDISKEISNIDTQIVDLKAQKAIAEQELNMAEMALVEVFEEEWQQGDLLISKPDFQEILHACTHDTNDPPKDSDELLTRMLLVLQEQFKQKTALIKKDIKGLQQIAAEEDQINREIALFKDRINRLRERIATDPNINSIWTSCEAVRNAENKISGLVTRKQELTDAKQELQEKASVLSKEIQGVEKKIEEIAEVVTEKAELENAANTTPLPIRPVPGA